MREEKNKGGGFAICTSRTKLFLNQVDYMSKLFCSGMFCCAKQAQVLFGCCIQLVDAAAEHLPK
jgi:hypothetical protein